MTLAELGDILKGIDGFADKVVYGAWQAQTAPTPPLICYEETRSGNFFADGIEYHTGHDVRISLCTLYKDIGTEALVEAALTAAGIAWTSAEQYIDEDKINIKTYEIEV